jgi:hypothetical protein
VRKAIVLTAALALAAAACSTPAVQRDPTTTVTPTWDPVVTVEDHGDDHDAMEMETTTTVPPTTTTTEVTWLSEMTDQEIADAQLGACGMVALGWLFGEPIPADQWADEFIELIETDNANDQARAIQESGHIFAEAKCPPVAFDDLVIPAGVEPYLREVSKSLLDR